MRKITLDAFKAELKAQGMSSHLDFAFRCPICKTIQSARDLISSGAGKSIDDVEKYLGFSCVGRFTNAGAHKRDAAPGRGCDWTLGGLLRLHELAVITPDGTEHPRFEVATPEEARALAATHATASPVIASEATQSSASQQGLDCFVADAPRNDEQAEGGAA